MISLITAVFKILIVLRVVACDVADGGEIKKSYALLSAILVAFTLNSALSILLLGEAVSCSDAIFTFFMLLFVLNSAGNLELLLSSLLGGSDGMGRKNAIE